MAIVLSDLNYFIHTSTLKIFLCNNDKYQNLHRIFKRARYITALYLLPQDYCYCSLSATLKLDFELVFAVTSSEKDPTTKSGT